MHLPSLSLLENQTVSKGAKSTTRETEATNERDGLRYQNCPKTARGRA